MIQTREEIVEEIEDIGNKYPIEVEAEYEDETLDVEVEWNLGPDSTQEIGVNLFKLTHSKIDALNANSDEKITKIEITVHTENLEKEAVEAYYEEHGHLYDDHEIKNNGDLVLVESTFNP